ncbi:MAG: UbiX family flavin prenyltransferase [Spirochaetaceae bacterium]|nr:MAG: UbiX family flavin prenyltransferase [Spirochaetaceae bacterium]
MNIVVGISGATGVIFGIRILEVLRRQPDVFTHLVVSPSASKTIVLETRFNEGQVIALADKVYPFRNIAASISSGSFPVDAMVVAPCSAKTLAGIATGYSDNLLVRAAEVTLKERRRLILMVRETPLHAVHLQNMLTVTQMGAIVMPPVPAFYHRPNTIEEIVDQTVNRALDLLGIPLPKDLFERWDGGRSDPADREPLTSANPSSRQGDNNGETASD